jgi:hypothetical protein
MATTATQSHTERQAMLEKEGKYLTFALAHEEYGLEIRNRRAHGIIPHRAKGKFRIRQHGQFLLDAECQMRA